MSSDYKVRYLLDDLIESAAMACWHAAPPNRSYIFDPIKVLEVLATKGIDYVFRLKGDRRKGLLEIEFFESESWWEKPAKVVFAKTVKLFVDRAVWARAKAGDAFACFILAHEIGHILLHDNDAKDFSHHEQDRLSFVSSEDSAEGQANNFAGHAMVPTHIIRRFKDVEVLTVLCNAPEKLVLERVDAVCRKRQLSEFHLSKDYCSDCGDYADLVLGTCVDCRPKA